MSGAPLAGAAGTVGLYGKMPSVGDFIRADLPSAFITPWDDWLQRCLQASRATLADRWTATYLESPIWRFALQTQVCGAQPWVGVLMPSVDRAGRYFPLTLAAPIAAAASALLTLAAAEHWFDQIEALALKALEPDTTVEALRALLARQSLPQVPATDAARADWEAAARLARWWTQPNAALALRLPATHALPAIAEFAAAQLMEASGSGRSLWWLHDDDHNVLTLRGWRGLPPPSEYAGLLTALRAAP
jgi:type VI secretion system protein ImpM